MKFILKNYLNYERCISISYKKQIGTAVKIFLNRWLRKGIHVLTIIPQTSTSTPRKR